MRFPRIIGLAILAATLSACSEGTTEPQIDTTQIVGDNAVFLATASVFDTTGDYREMRFGSIEIDTADFYLKDQQYFGYDATRLSVMTILDKSEPAGLSGPPYHVGGWVDEKKGFTVQVMSDWQPEASQSNRGVVGSDRTEFIFFISTYKYNEKENELNLVSRRVRIETKKAGKAAAKIELPPLKDGYYIVETSQRYSLACAGNGSQRFTSKTGLHIEVTTAYSNYIEQVKVHPTTDFSCDMYSDEATARRAQALRLQSR